MNWYESIVACQENHCPMSEIILEWFSDRTRLSGKSLPMQVTNANALILVSRRLTVTAARRPLIKALSKVSTFDLHANFSFIHPLFIISSSSHFGIYLWRCKDCEVTTHPLLNSWKLVIRTIIKQNYRYIVHLMRLIIIYSQVHHAPPIINNSKTVMQLMQFLEQIQSVNINLWFWSFQTTATRGSGFIIALKNHMQPLKNT